MIKSVGINNNVRFAMFNGVKNGHVNKSVNNNIAKSETSEVKEKPLLLSSFIQPQKQISFKSQVVLSVPDDWVVQNGGVVENGGVDSTNNFVDFDDAEAKPSFPSAKEFFESEESKGKVFPFYRVKYSEGKKVPMQNGFLYANADGRVTKIDYDFSRPAKENFDSEKSIDLNSGAYVPTTKQLEILVDYFDKANEKYLRNELLEKTMFETPSIRDIHVSALVEDGRAEEALELFPEQEERINKLESAYQRANLLDISEVDDELDRLLLAGDVKTILDNRGKYADRLPKSVVLLSEKEKKQVLNIFKDKTYLPAYHYQAINKAKKAAYLEEVNGEPTKAERVAIAVMSLGVSEILSSNRYNMDYSSDIYQSLHRQIDAVSELSEMIIARREERNINVKERETKILEAEQKRCDVKNQIEKLLLAPIKEYAKNENIFLPNAVMLQGENPHIMKDIISSIPKENDFVNFVSVASKRDYDTMQEELFEQLELAEENYQKTNKRSIIFVNGMEKLLNPQLNTAGNIACMKDIMSSASEDYHSTIIFCATNPEKLDKGLLMSHRVSYKIDVPFASVQVKG